MLLIGIIFWRIPKYIKNIYMRKKEKQDAQLQTK